MAEQRTRSPYAPGSAAKFFQSGGSVPFLKIASNSTLVMGGSTMSFCGWVQFTGVSNPSQHLMTKLTGAVGTDEYFLQVNSTTTLRWGISNGSTYSVANWSAAITNGVWYFIYGDWDGSDLHLNVDNGTPVTQAGTGPINTGTSAFRFGADGADGVDVNAILDAFGIWKGRVLTAGEQTQLYNGGNGLSLRRLPASLTINLVSWWDFDGKTAGVWIDSYGTNDLTDVNDSVTVVAGKS
jgi:hypothetical protein